MYVVCSKDKKGGILILTPVPCKHIEEAVNEMNRLVKIDGIDPFNKVYQIYELKEVQ